MSRPRKPKSGQIDRRTPKDKVYTQHSTLEGHQNLIGVFQGLGIDVAPDDPGFVRPFNENRALAQINLAANQSSVDLLDEDPNSFPPLTAAACAAAKRLLSANQLLFDPLNEDPSFSLLLAQLTITWDDDVFRKGLGDMMVDILEKCSADETEALFKRFVTLKRNVERPPHRNCYAIAAYNNFIFDTGKEPSKCHLRKYMMARLEEYRDQPAPGDAKGWTRLWRDTGLFKLPER